MMRRVNSFGRALLLLWAAAILSCGGGARDLMIPASRVKKPEPDFALVTFVRSNVMAFGQKAMLWDREQLLGELNPRRYIQYKAAPGNHLFLMKSGSWSYLNANLSPGKHYVVRARVYPGGNAARIELEPVLPFEDTVSKTEVDEWLLALEPEKAISEYAEVYGNPYLPEVRRAAAKYDDGKIDCTTLNPGDDWPHLALNPPDESN